MVSLVVRFVPGHEHQAEVPGGAVDRAALRTGEGAEGEVAVVDGQVGAVDQRPHGTLFRDGQVAIPPVVVVVQHVVDEVERNRTVRLLHVLVDHCDRRRLLLLVGLCLVGVPPVVDELCPPQHRVVVVLVVLVRLRFRSLRLGGALHVLVVRQPELIVERARGLHTDHRDFVRFGVRALAVEIALRGSADVAHEHTAGAVQVDRCLVRIGFVHRELEVVLVHDVVVVGAAGEVPPVGFGVAGDLDVARMQRVVRVREAGEVVCAARVPPAVVHPVPALHRTGLDQSSPDRLTAPRGVAVATDGDGEVVLRGLTPGDAVAVRVAVVHHPHRGFRHPRAVDDVGAVARLHIGVLVGASASEAAAGDDRTDQQKKIEKTRTHG